MRIIFQTSTACNLRCTYCYQCNKQSNILSFDKSKALINDLILYKINMPQSSLFYFTIIDESTLDKIELNFFGGECTLHINLIEQICDYFVSMCNKYNITEWLDNYSILIETNGTTFLQPNVYKFYEKYKDHLTCSISIDGCKSCHDKCRRYADGTGSYDNVIQAIEAYKQLLNCCPTSKLT